MRFSIIIPCFNEGKRVLKVVSQAKKSRYASDVIVVDDGSDFKTKNILSKVSGIHLITHLKNEGKASALKTGVDASKYDNLIFLDADLKGLKVLHIDMLAKSLSHADLVLGYRPKEYFLTNLLGFGLAYTGERALKKVILLKYKDIFNAYGYLIEPAINKYFFKKQKVSMVRLEGLGQTWKIQKTGVSGLLNDFKMYCTYIRYLGISEMLFQMRFCLELQKSYKTYML